MSALNLSRIATSAPALNRGMAVLAVLGEESPLPLEAIVSRLRLPKASVFRLLDTLQRIGAVRKREDKRYEPLWLLRPVGDSMASLRERLDRPMHVLAIEAACTAEWYESDAEGMRLVLQKQPRTELHVVARPGFVREWNTELDAVACVGYAFARSAPPLKGPVAIYSTDGIRCSLSQRRAVSLIHKAREARGAADVHCNSNGVRRHAVPAFQDGMLAGVLALAESFRFGPRPDESRHLNLLQTTLTNLS